MDRVNRLLQSGYLPFQLPPSFQTTDLAKNYSKLLSIWPNDKSRASKTETFSVARVGHLRRATGIPNPVAQIYLSLAVVNNWGKIIKHFRKSNISASRPRFRHSATRAAALPSMHILYEKRLLQGAGYRYVLRTDISRFFPTIYTHSIPWALHSKKIAKKNRDITSEYFGNSIDLAMRQCQDGQTIGLPIGPDTSSIISECIATAIDIDFENKLGFKPAGFRYVDDYYLFFETYSAAESALAYLIKCLKEFELQINFDKTKICKIEELDEDVWTHKLRSFSIASDGLKQKSDLTHFFEIARELAKTHQDHSVIVYALRRLGSIIVRKENWHAFEAQLCLAATAYPVALQAIARLLSTYLSIGYSIDKIRVSRLINALLIEHAPLDHHSEVSWCLWMCKELNLNLNTETVDIIAEMSSSVCLLQLFDLSAAGKLPEKLSSSRWHYLVSSTALWEEQWMLSYEAGVRGWEGMSDNHIRADTHFKELEKLDIRFFNEHARLEPLFKIKPDALKIYHVESIDDLLEFDDLDSIFEYTDDDDIYGSPIENKDFNIDDLL